MTAIDHLHNSRLAAHYCFFLVILVVSSAMTQINIANSQDLTSDYSDSQRLLITVWTHGEAQVHWKNEESHVYLYN